jgi:hypothetical protein
MKLITLLPILIYIILIVKLFYVIFTLSDIYLEKVKKNMDKNDFTSIWKDRTDFIFTALMSLLLLIIFNPWYNNTYLMNREMKLLFFIFGIISITTANWKLFFKEAPWYETAVTAWK